MKDIELKEKFIEMRVAGDSYDKIAKELNKSKTTLIKWDRELSKEISNLGSNSQKLQNLSWRDSFEKEFVPSA